MLWTFIAGANDIPGNTGPMPLEAIEGNLMSMVELANANGVKVVLVSVHAGDRCAQAANGAPHRS